MDTLITTRPGYQLRVIEEKTELDKKLAALTEFNSKPNDLLGDVNTLLQRQQSVMTEYSKVLGERIYLFDNPQIEETPSVDPIV